MKKLRTIRAVLTASLLLLFFTSPALADRLDEIKSRGSLWVGVSDTTRFMATKKRAAEAARLA